MRELDATEIMAVRGAGVTFTTPLTLGMLNDISTLSGVGRYVTAAFSAGWSVGTYLNNKFDLSTRIVDAIY